MQIIDLLVIFKRFVFLDASPLCAYANKKVCFGLSDRPLLEPLDPNFLLLQFLTKNNKI